MKTMWTSAKFLAVLLSLASALLVVGLVWVDGLASALLIGVAFIGLTCFLFLALCWAKQAFSEIKLSSRQLDHKLKAIQNENSQMREAFTELQQNLPIEVSRKLDENLSVALNASLSSFRADFSGEIDRKLGQRIDSDLRRIIESSIIATKQQWEVSLGQRLKGTERQIEKNLQHVVAHELSSRFSESNESIELGFEKSEASVELAKNKIIASLGRIGRVQSVLEKKLESQQSAIPSRVVKDVLSELDGRRSSVTGLESATSAYSINAVPPMNVVKSNTPGAIGRSAATIEVEGNSTEHLRLLNDAAPEVWQANTATVASDSINKAIQTSYDVVEISPNQAVVNTQLSWDFVVIEESCLTVGGWAGTLETFKLQTYMDLESFILRAQNQGAIVIVIESRIHYAMTNSLRKLADVRINTNGEVAAQNGSVVSLDICQKMIDAIYSEEEQNA